MANILTREKQLAVLSGLFEPYVFFFVTRCLRRLRWFAQARAIPEAHWIHRPIHHDGYLKK